MINGSFVFGLDDDDKGVFKRTVDRGVKNSITTSTYHVLTPYPGTELFRQMEERDRILTRNWNMYDTRTVLYKTENMTAAELEKGYWWAYKEFYKWSNIFEGSIRHESYSHKLKHFCYAGGWKKFEPVWNFMIKTKNLNNTLPLLEGVLSKVRGSGDRGGIEEILPDPL